MAGIMKTLTRSMVKHAHAIAREVGARVIMLHADVVEEDADLSGLIEDVDFRIILVSRRPGFHAPVERTDMCSVVRVPDIAMTRAGQVKVATLVAAAESLIKAGDRILCLTGIDRSGSIDTIMVLDMGTEIELFSASTADPLPRDVTPAVFERILTMASELGVEGREGRTGRDAVRDRRQRPRALAEPSTRVQPLPRLSRGRPEHPRPSAGGDDQGVLGDRRRVRRPGRRRGPECGRVTSPPAASSRSPFPRAWAPGTRRPRRSP